MRLPIALAVLLLSVSASAATVKEGTRVTLMGDSEAFLLSWELPKLAEQTGAPFKAVTVPGSSVISWGRELDKQWAKIRATKPDVLLVSLGANDACTGPRVVGNEGPFLEMFKRKLKRTGAKCVAWLGPPQVGAASPTKEQCALGLARPGLDAFASMIVAAGFAYLDARTIQVQLWNDQLHCSRPMHAADPAHGCRDWAGWIWNRLRDEDLCHAEE